jgi:hypothetical protein
LHVFGFQEHRRFSESRWSFSSAMTLARLHSDNHNFTTRFRRLCSLAWICVRLRPRYCRAASFEPTRPIATDSAAHLRTSEARSSSSGARSEMEDITTQFDVKTFFVLFDKSF